MPCIYKSVMESKCTSYYSFWHTIICIISAADLLIHFIYLLKRRDNLCISTEHIQQKRKSNTLHNSSTGSLAILRVYQYFQP